MNADSELLEKYIVETYGYRNMNYKCLYNMAADIIRFSLFILCNNALCNSEWTYVDIRSILYHSRHQFNNILEILNGNYCSYFSEECEVEPVDFILNQLVSYGEIVKIKNGKIMPTPSSIIEIQEHSAYAIIGAIPIHNIGISTDQIKYQGVARLTEKVDNVLNQLPRRAINDWLIIPSDKIGLSKWFESLIASLEFHDTVLTDNYEIFDIRLFKGYKTSVCWIGIDQYKSNSHQYFLARSPAVETKYRYWIVQGPIVDKKCKLTQLNDYYWNRALCGFLISNRKAPILFYSEKNDEVYVQFNIALIPREEMRLISAFSYPYPKVKKYNNSWVMDKKIWNIIKPYFDKLGFEFIKSDNVY